MAEDHGPRTVALRFITLSGQCERISGDLFIMGNSVVNF